MSCVKTGFHAYCEPHQLWLYGDAYQLNECLVLRICEISRSPLRVFKHYTIHDWSMWFDQDVTSMNRNSTMISVKYDDHGYDGVPV